MRHDKGLVILVLARVFGFNLLEGDLKPIIFPPLFLECQVFGLFEYMFMSKYLSIFLFGAWESRL